MSLQSTGRTPRDMINYAVKSMMVKSGKPKLFNSIVAVDKQTVLSSLTRDTSSG
jgi:hypothetical protein